MIIETLLSFIRGGIVRIRILITCPKCTIGSHFRIGKNCRVRIRKNSRMIIGNNVTLGDSSKLSVLNGGILSIEDNVGIGDYCQIVCHESITIEQDCNIAPFVCMFDHDHVFTKENGVERKQFTTKPITIKEKTWIAVNSVILKGSLIGKRCVIGAGSIIKQDVPDNTLLIQKRLSTEYEIGNNKS